MASINRTQIQLLSSVAYARGAQALVVGALLVVFVAFAWRILEPTPPALRDLAALSRRLAGELQDDWWRLLAHAEKLEREIAELERPAPAGGVVIPLRPRRTVMQQQQEPKPPAPAPKDDNPEP